VKVGSAATPIKPPAIQMWRGRYAELHTALALVLESIALAYRLRHNPGPKRDPRFTR